MILNILCSCNAIVIMRHTNTCQNTRNHLYTVSLKFYLCNLEYLVHCKSVAMKLSMLYPDDLSH